MQLGDPDEDDRRAPTPPPHAFAARRPPTAYTCTHKLLLFTGLLMVVFMLRNMVTKNYEAIGKDYLRAHGREKEIEQVFPKTAREAVQEGKMSTKNQLELMADAIDGLRADVDALKAMLNVTSANATSTNQPGKPGS